MPVGTEVFAVTGGEFLADFTTVNTPPISIEAVGVPERPMIIGKPPLPAPLFRAPVYPSSAADPIP